MKTMIASLLILTAGFAYSPVMSESGQLHKPMPPLTVNISLVQKGVSPADVKPGDVVELLAVAKTSLDSPEMSISVVLAGGAELVSGDLFWKGRATAGREQILRFSVRVPLAGQGRLVARVSVSDGKGVVFGSESTCILGPEAQSKPLQTVPLKKDKKGRPIMEYRAE